MDFFDPKQTTLLGYRVLVRVDEPEDELEAKMKDAGLAVPDSMRLKREYSIAKAETGEVVMVGPDVEPGWAMPGDRVMITRTGGADRKSEDGTYFRIIMGEDIIARAKREGE